ncbi:hypothetical protein Pint_32319 [Pistacia integerrima]|uniref:Uncharacterized protein n=2 Tax=Pistacia TaxID=55512 RepID=A0ACC1AA95_9ROSI|nr:hypothetical protein Pint_32319 [Pistacia integerrima]KAJ0083197.1 hypothetical protein Patl1_30859 [Pistacia atlantica]
MAPLRGGLKKKRKLDKKTEGNASASGSSEKEASVDWWHEYSERINDYLLINENAFGNIYAGSLI